MAPLKTQDIKHEGAIVESIDPTRSTRLPVRTMLALKLHALKHTRAHRFLKDFQDVEGLVRINQLDLQSENIRQMFIKYGTLELYEKVIRACTGT